MNVKRLSEINKRELDNIGIDLNQIVSKCRRITYSDLSVNELFRIESPFIEHNIEKYIKDTLYYRCQYTVGINSNISITIYLCDETIPRFDEYTLYILLQIVSGIMLVLNTFNKNINQQQIDIMYFDIHKPKYLNSTNPLTQHPIGCIGVNINSGMTLIKTKQMTIWRFDELVRTVIHETIHSIDVDLKNTDIVAQIKYIIKNEHNKKLNVPTLNKYIDARGFDFNEMYTEFLTMHIYAKWYAYMNDTDFKKEFKKLIDVSKKQTQVLLNYINSTNFDCTIENSNVLSYIYLKTIMISSNENLRLMYSLIECIQSESNQEILIQIVNVIEKDFTKVISRIQSNKNIMKYTEYMFYF